MAAYDWSKGLVKGLFWGGLLGVVIGILLTTKRNKGTWEKIGKSADELYDKILNIVVVQKKYKDPNYSAKDLAKELKTNTRYLSAVVNSRFGMNYSCLLNEYRIKDALHLLVDKRYMDKNVEEISAMVGFANRQSFYAAFYKNVGETPNGYRKRNQEKK